MCGDDSCVWCWFWYRGIDFIVFNFCLHPSFIVIPLFFYMLVNNVKMWRSINNKKILKRDGNLCYKNIFFDKRASSHTDSYIHKFFMLQYDVAKKGRRRRKKSIYAKIFSCVREVMMWKCRSKANGNMNELEK